ncbi:Heavy metal-associated domain containing protein [Parasponia andersonii]|uniref:Heavy metal-associated domain containing protein n=1 Tax=Parasponia andersonii TaxID=3476 RepID=A0A2P5C6U3_PARAD|nr:Heavy metal-associated domain containing protein [Parasponia andersonii]
MATKEGAVITAVYKASLHCQQCAREIKRPLLRTQGVQTVEIDMEKDEIKAKGSFDPIKVQKRIQKLSKKKIELISPKLQIKGAIQTEKKVTKETKQVVWRTTTVKLHMHCDQCERELKKKLLKQKGIQSVKSDMKAQILTVDGTIEADKLVSFLRRKVHKHAEIIKEKDEITSGSVKKTVEIKDEVKVVEIKTKEGKSPYFIHYVYAPQLFSDENPNACTIS